ncbi:MAG: transcriptional repressor LexA [Deltaproteobacteria bacterium]|nr:transcriptional repressor LexA [Deltaproteobacteria bacterium]
MLKDATNEKALTMRQKSVLEYIKEQMESKGYPPSIREIASGLGIKGPSAVLKHLKILEKKGFIRRSTSGASRAIELIRKVPGNMKNTMKNTLQNTIRIVKDSTAETITETVTLPLLGQVKAGPLSEAIEHPEDEYTLDMRLFKYPKGADPDKAFLLRADGWSMTNAGIDDGDLMLIHPTPVAKNGDIIVARHWGEATVKRFLMKDDKVILKPENPDMEPIEITGGEFSIIGKVISVIKDIS